jgi:hypothetical protein
MVLETTLKIKIVLTESRLLQLASLSKLTLFIPKIIMTKLSSQIQPRITHLMDFYFSTTIQIKRVGFMICLPSSAESCMTYSPPDAIYSLRHATALRSIALWRTPNFSRPVDLPTVARWIANGRPWNC